MKKELIGLSQRYLTALGKHLQHSSRVTLRAALELGRQAVDFRLDTLSLARIHEQALGGLVLAGGSAAARAGRVRSAGIFFAEANAPIEETHLAAQQGRAHLIQMKAKLGQRTQELATSNRKLQRGNVRQKVMAAAYAKSGKRHDKSLGESLQLQNRLRQLTHQVLAAQESDRKKISHELQDEIAQTLLGINVRLLSLKRGAGGDIKGLQDEIASAQRLVVKSAQTMRRFARDLAVHHAA